jgi:hypothetical protein
MESIQGIMIRAEVFRQTLSAESLDGTSGTAPHRQRCRCGRQAHDATRKLVHHEENPIGSQRCGFAAEQIAAPQTVLHVAEKGEPGWTLQGWDRHSGANPLLRAHNLRLGNDSDGIGQRRSVSARFYLRH